jgi:alcohol dehydrogenase (cytochrome c)
MKLVSLVYLLSAAAIALSVARVSAKDAASGPSFTTTQATKGQATYLANCSMCHGTKLEGVYAPALNGPDSNVQWLPVKAVYGYMSVTMPVGNAGGLASTDYANIMAFLLKAHGHHPGSAPLTPSVAADSSALVGP